LDGVAQVDLRGVGRRAVERHDQRAAREPPLPVAGTARVSSGGHHDDRGEQQDGEDDAHDGGRYSTGGRINRW
jgi:hypothetical protein